MSLLVATSLLVHGHAEPKEKFQPKCMSLCERSPTAWASKCTWATLQCAGCPLCPPPSPPAASDDGFYDASEREYVDTDGKKKSTVQGLTWHEGHQKWSVEAHINGASKFLGVFKDHAAAAYRLRRHHGELAEAEKQKALLNSKKKSVQNALKKGEYVVVQQKDWDLKWRVGCEPWCAKSRSNWQAKCNYGPTVCSQCDPCFPPDRGNATSISPASHKEPGQPVSVWGEYGAEKPKAQGATTAVSGCEPWCSEHLTHWFRKCRWKSHCNNCTACFDKNITSAYVPEPELMGQADCEPWCEDTQGHTGASQPWAVKCGWPGLHCTTCDACFPNTTLAEAEESREGEPGCEPWCDYHIVDFKKRCNWKSQCNNCTGCASLTRGPALTAEQRAMTVEQRVADRVATRMAERGEGLEKICADTRARIAPRCADRPLP